MSWGGALQLGPHPGVNAPGDWSLLVCAGLRIDLEDLEDSAVMCGLSWCCRGSGGGRLAGIAEVPPGVALGRGASSPPRLGSARVYD